MRGVFDILTQIRHKRYCQLTACGIYSKYRVAQLARALGRWFESSPEKKARVARGGQGVNPHESYNMTRVSEVVITPAS